MTIDIKNPKQKRYQQETASARALGGSHTHPTRWHRGNTCPHRRPAATHTSPPAPCDSPVRTPSRRVRHCTAGYTHALATSLFGHAPFFNCMVRETMRCTHPHHRASDILYEATWSRLQSKTLHCVYTRIDVMLQDFASGILRLGNSHCTMCTLAKFVTHIFPTAQICSSTGKPTTAKRTYKIAEVHANSDAIVASPTRWCECHQRCHRPDRLVRIAGRLRHCEPQTSGGCTGRRTLTSKLLAAFTQRLGWFPPCRRCTITKRRVVQGMTAGNMCMGSTWRTHHLNDVAMGPQCNPNTATA